MTATLFLHQGRWKLSVPTSIGFRHHDVGNVVTFPTRELAEARVDELVARGDLPQLP